MREDRHQRWYDLKQNWTVFRHNGRFLLFYHWFQDNHNSNFVPVRPRITKDIICPVKKHDKIFQNSPRHPWSYISSIFHEHGPYHWEVSRTKCRRKSEKMTLDYQPEPNHGKDKLNQPFLKFKLFSLIHSLWLINYNGSHVKYTIMAECIWSFHGKYTIFRRKVYDGEIVKL